MAFTYDGTLDTDLEKVRHKIGDTNSNDPLLTDAEVNYELAQRGNVLAASYHCVQAILARFARDSDRSNLGMNSSRSQKFQQYKDLLGQLEAELQGGAEVFFGGTSLADKDSVNSDDDYVQSAFARGDDDNDG
jgi:hypothetical protein